MMMLRTLPTTFALGFIAAIGLTACGGQGSSGAGAAEAEAPKNLAKDHRGEGAALTMDGVLVYLPFDGDLLDRSDQENHASTSTTLGTDRFGLAEGAAVFDGVQEYLVLEKAALPRKPTAFTTSFWVQTRATDTTTLVFAGAINDGAMWLRLNPVKQTLTAMSQGVFKVEIPAAIARVFEAKGRPLYDPLIVHVAPGAPSEALAGWARADVIDTLAPLAPFWPGPLTLVVPRDPSVHDLVTAGLDTVAIRMPAHPVAQALLADHGPVVAPSADWIERLHVEFDGLDLFRAAGEQGERCHQNDACPSAHQE